METQTSTADLMEDSKRWEEKHHQIQGKRSIIKLSEVCSQMSWNSRKTSSRCVANSKFQENESPPLIKLDWPCKQPHTLNNMVQLNYVVLAPQ